MSCMPVTVGWDSVCIGICSLFTCSSLSPSPSPACSRAIASSSLVFSSCGCVHIQMRISNVIICTHAPSHYHPPILTIYYYLVEEGRIPSRQSSYLAVGLELLLLSLQVFIHGNQCTQLLQNTGGGQHTPNIPWLEKAK